MKVENIAKCSHWSILQYFSPALGNNRPENPLLVFFLSGRLRQILLYTSLVKIKLKVQKITHGNHILDISKCCCDLEN